MYAVESTFNGEAMGGFVGSAGIAGELYLSRRGEELELYEACESMKSPAMLPKHDAKYQSIE